jgi:hypothetical protein
MVFAAFVFCLMFIATFIFWACCAVNSALEDVFEPDNNTDRRWDSEDLE